MLLPAFKISSSQSFLPFTCYLTHTLIDCSIFDYSADVMHVSALLLLGPAAVLAFPSLQRRQDINVDRMLESRQDLDYTQWSRPGPGDVRGPCPAMNSLANHGFLPRNGKDITLGMLQKVLPAAVNVGADLADVFYAGTIGMGLTHLNGKFDLDALNKHNAIEHDGSLSRADASTGDNFSFNQTIFDSYMAFYDGVAEANPELAGKARMARIKTEQARDPKFKYGPKAQLISNGETALILGVFGDVETGIAPVEFIRIWFGK